MTVSGEAAYPDDTQDYQLVALQIARSGPALWYIRIGLLSWLVKRGTKASVVPLSELEDKAVGPELFKPWSARRPWPLHMD